MNAKDLRDKVEDIYELSALQQGMLVHSLSAPESAVYFEQFSCTIEGHLEPVTFRRAWETALTQHPVLRAALYWEDLDKPYQVVYRTVELPWSDLDWSGIDEAERQQQLEAHLLADRRRNFDLTRAPLMRFALIRLAEDSHHFIWSFHHVLLDGWSVALLNSEVLKNYKAMLRQDEIAVKDVRPYRDYIVWLQQQDPATAENFWRRTLSGFSTPTPLPCDHLSAGAADRDEDYQEQHLTLSAAITTDLRSLARRHQLTLNTIIQAMWGLLLSRYSGEQDVVWGSTVAGRPATLNGAESMIGLFINTLPVRARLNGQQSVLSWMKQLQQDQMDARQYEYSSLTEIQGWSDVPRSLALFETLLVVENYPLGETSDATDNGLTIRNIRSFEKTNYPLSILVAPAAELELKLFYDGRRFEATTIRRMLGHCQTLLEAFVLDVDQPLSDISLLSAGERDQILFEWNQTAAPFPSNQCIHQLFESHAERHPNKTAVVCGADELTYDQLNTRANQLARYLQKLGVKPDSLVGICIERSLEMVVAILGVMKAGAAYVPLDPSYPQERLAFMLDDAQVRVLLTQQSLLPSLPAHHAKFTCLDIGWELIAQEDRSNVESGLEVNNLAYVIYTSGSTGRPKGAMVEHRGLSNLGEAQLLAFDLKPSDRVLQFASLSFDASIFEMVMAWKTGATICVATGDALISGEALGRLLEEQAITNVVLTPSVLSTVPAGSFPALKTVTVAGEACPGELVSRWCSGRRFFNLYGPTETTVWAAYAECDKSTERPPIGRPIINAEAYILDAQLRPVPVGVAGELHVGGVGLARGYLHRPELTAEKFIPHPFNDDPDAKLYKTGDLVRYATDGNIEFLGRIDQQVKLRGFRIELGEIETLIADYPGVQEVVLIAREDEPSQKKLVAYVVAEAKAHVDTLELREALKKKLPPYMIPSAIVVLDKFPLTPNSKLDRNALPAVEGIGDEHKNAFVAPESGIESAIASVWSEVLKVKRVGRNDNFFDLGGHSLLITSVHSKLVAATGAKLSFVDLFKYPTVSSLAAYLNATYINKDANLVSPILKPSREPQEPIAIIGMAGRFPGARSVAELWQNLRLGMESIRQFTDEELKAAGVSEAELANPNYIKAGSVLEDAEFFDAQFFGFNPREAEVTDPQHRLFLECAHQALDSSGYNATAFPSLIGVFAGCTPSSYLFNNIYTNPDLLKAVDSYQIGLSNDKDFVPTRVSYKLNLRGPSVNVQSACSTSLVAVHLACQSLLNRECQIALAGGVTINYPQPAGYWYHEEGIRSPDGHCRTFDSQAQGTVGGNGVGIVVLKRLSDAIADGDHIRAVIKGSAINNDGSNKLGYTAPSVDGQAAVIAAAQAAAGVSPDSITYVEAHGTGTLLGDPIEVAALTQAFRLGTNRNGFCGLGSVKSNLGHLDAAAGVTGLIKTVLQLENRQLAPSLHFQEPNPELHLDKSPFYVNAELKDWTVGEAEIRRAGVSSFGIGGTNAHVIVEEAPAIASDDLGREWQLLTVSAKSESSLERASQELAAYLSAANDKARFADVAYTMNSGRQEYECRRVVICRDATEAKKALQGELSQQSFRGTASELDRSVTFMFPGQAAQYPDMGHGLYQTEPAFRAVVDECAELLKPHLGLDLRTILYPQNKDDAGQADQLKQTSLTQPAIFVTEYALARLLMSWGVLPGAMIGHSIGEYVAACLAGVFSLKDALRVVVERGRLMQALPPGSMLAVPLSEESIRDLLPEELSLAAVNAPHLCVVSGPETAIAAFEQSLITRGLSCTRLRTSHAFHSSMMDPILKPFTELLGTIERSAPVIPYIANVTGTWITAAEATDPEYWTRHIRQPVRFADGVEELLKDSDGVLLEVGPGQTLSTLTKVQTANRANQLVLGSMRAARDSQSDVFVILKTLARLWASGAGIDWTAFYSNQRRLRVPLPTYSFDRQRYWIEPGRNFDRSVTRPQIISKHPKIDDWFYTPSWKRSSLPVRTHDSWEKSVLLVFTDELGIGTGIVDNLRSRHVNVVTVKRGESFTRLSDCAYTIHGDMAQHYETLLKQVCADGKTVQKVVHLWGLQSSDSFASAQHAGFHSLLNLARAVTAVQAQEELKIEVITSGVHDVNGEEALHPENATVLGACKVIGQEFSNITCRSIDVELDIAEEQRPRLVQQLSREITSSSSDHIVAYRGNHRWVQMFERVQLDHDPAHGKLRDRGVYLITGGMGNIGFALAKHLALTAKARLILVSRKALPPKDEWDQWLAGHSADDVVSKRIRGVRELENLGAQVLYEAADVGDEQQMNAVVQRGEERFGEINGLIHAAGILVDEAFKPITRMNGRESDWHFHAKATGTLVLEKILQDRQLDFCLLFSSLSTILGGLGYAAYSAANSFLDVFACKQNRTGRMFWTSINWDGWQFNGDSQITTQPQLASLALLPDEALKVFDRILSSEHVPQIIVSTGDLPSRLSIWQQQETSEQRNGDKTNGNIKSYPRPVLHNEYVEARHDVDRAIINIWRESLGVEHVGIHDNFFELGGHSLLATQVIAELNKTFPVGFSIADLFERSTVFALSNMVLQEEQGEPLFMDSSSRGQARRERQLRRVAPQQGV